jgi:hypothetical protein
MGIFSAVTGFREHRIRRLVLWLTFAAHFSIQGVAHSSESQTGQGDIAPWSTDPHIPAGRDHPTGGAHGTEYAHSGRGAFTEDQTHDATWLQQLVVFLLTLRSEVPWISVADSSREP